MTIQMVDLSNIEQLNNIEEQKCDFIYIYIILLFI